MKFSIQTILENNQIALYPLIESDFESLYEVASDPKIWEQHPNQNRWKKEIFTTFFEGAIESKGAFKIIDKNNNNLLGSTRFYNYNEQENSILIGYTFYATKCWGKGINQMVKKLMLDYVFQFVSKVYFHVGAGNIRSQIAVSRLGTKKTGEQKDTFFAEPKLDFIYELTKNDWLKHKNSN
jgi:RimJ/RimL family protein N-acetyltransferase